MKPTQPGDERIIMDYLMQQLERKEKEVAEIKKKIRKLIQR